MLIDTPGKYLTRGGKTVDIVRLDRTTAIGRLPDERDPLVWDIQDGGAIGHALENSIVGKSRNLPATAVQITQILGALDSNQQRLQVLNILRQQVCLDCGSISVPGLKCECQSPKAPIQRGKSRKKTVH